MRARLDAVPLRLDFAALAAFGARAGAPGDLAGLPELHTLAAELMENGWVNAGDSPRAPATTAFAAARAACEARRPGIWPDEGGIACPWMTPAMWGARAVADALARLARQADAGDRRAGPSLKKALAKAEEHARALLGLLGHALREPKRVLPLVEAIHREGSHLHSALGAAGVVLVLSPQELAAAAPATVAA